MIRLSSGDFSKDASAPWVLPADARERKVLSAIHRNSRPLGSVAEARNGIQTSANAVFLISQFVRKGKLIEFVKKGRTWEIEAAATRPYLDDSSRIKTFHALTSDALVIFPYQSSGNTRNSSGVEVIPVAQMRRQLPLTLKYLEHHRSTLARRDGPQSGQPFYVFGRTQALGYCTDKPKIIYSVNQRGEKYGVDVTGISYASGGTAGEVGLFVSDETYEIDFLLGLLSQAPIEFFLRKRGSPFRGGYYSRGSDVIVDVPVPNLDANDTSDMLFEKTVVDSVRAIREATVNLSAASPRQVEQLHHRVEREKKSVADAFAGRWGLDPAEYSRLGHGLGPLGVTY